jgi:transcriptional regulator with XRE-family HTH domain
MSLQQRIGLRIRTFRKQRGLTQEQLGYLVDRATTSVSNMERGLTLPPLDLLEAVSVHLGVNLRDLFDFDLGTAKSRVRLDREAQLLGLARQLPVDDLNALVGVAESLMKRGSKKPTR